VVAQGRHAGLPLHEKSGPVLNCGTGSVAFCQLKLNTKIPRSKEEYINKHGLRRSYKNASEWDYFLNKALVNSEIMSVLLKVPKTDFP
jgi:hypothetical protein